MKGLSASELADLVGATEVEVQRLVDLGILVARDGAGPFLETDVQKVRLATACEQAGLPMDGIASAIRAGRLSFTFLEAAPFRRWAVRSTRTYRQVSQETGCRSTRSGRCWSRWGSPGQVLMSRCARTSWRWCHWWPTAYPAGSSTRPGWPGSAGPTWRGCG
jgi:hypothetical protein